MIEEGDRVLPIREGDRVLLVGKGDREYYVAAGPRTLSTDLGMIDLSVLVGAEPGSVVRTHKGQEFTLRIPRAPDFFTHASRSGAPMLPKDVGMVIAYTGMNRRDRVLDAGTGSGVAAIYFGGVAGHVRTYEIREEFAEKARKNVAAAKLANVDVVAGDVLSAEGGYEVVHLDMQTGEEHVAHAHRLLAPGGFLACYTPFLEQVFAIHDAALTLFSQVRVVECIERELTRSARGTRPSTRVCHSGYLTFARK
ncbi:MAG: protein-L-isoaspartate carboxylmethyltransferase [Methanomicrobiales archaeon]|nr:protein-L-isoaspartate carboxylmethyltransferase [Methanomicrobiales archaeon]